MYNKLNRYEFIGSTRENSYTNLINFIGVNNVEDKYFDNKYFAPSVTKEGFGVLFIEMKTLNTEISEDKTTIIMHFTEKNTMVPKYDKPILVCIKYEKAALFKFYGMYTITKYTDKEIVLEDYNPTYFTDKDNVKMVYEY